MIVQIAGHSYVFEGRTLWLMGAASLVEYSFVIFFVVRHRRNKRRRIQDTPWPRRDGG
jgi:hypothetical protein